MAINWPQVPKNQATLLGVGCGFEVRAGAGHVRDSEDEHQEQVAQRCRYCRIEWLSRIPDQEGVVTKNYVARMTSQGDRPTRKAVKSYDEQAREPSFGLGGEQ